MKNPTASVFDGLTQSEKRSAAWVALATFIGAIIGGVVCYFQQPVYRAEILLSVVEGDAQGASAALGQTLGGLSALAGINLRGASDRRPRYIAFLRSRAFTERFIQTEDLADDLFHERWDSHRKRWKDGVKAPTTGDLFTRFDRQVRDLREDKFSGLLTLQIDWRDRDSAARWANSIVKSANAELRQQAIHDARQSIEFLQKELDTALVLELKQSIYRLMETQVNAVMLANVREDYAFQVLDPAVVADEDKYIRPRLVVMLAVGAAAGAGMAAFILFGVRALRRRAADRRQVDHDASEAP